MSINLFESNFKNEKEDFVEYNMHDSISQILSMYSLEAKSSFEQILSEIEFLKTKGFFCVLSMKYDSKIFERINESA